MGTSSANVNTSERDRRIEMVLEKLRPMIQADGGDVEYRGTTDDGIVEVCLKGACVGCPSSERTLRDGIERNLRAYVPGIEGVRAVDPGDSGDSTAG